MENRTAVPLYLCKKQLLDEYKISVWRDHDYVHSGIPLHDGTYTDGIFYGFAKALVWEDYVIERIDNKEQISLFKIPEITADGVAHQLIDKFNLEGARILGNPKTKIKKVGILFHIFVDANEEIMRIDKENIVSFKVN